MGKLKSIKKRDSSQDIKEVIRDNEKGELEEWLKRVLKISLWRGLFREASWMYDDESTLPSSKGMASLGKVDKI